MHVGTTPIKLAYRAGALLAAFHDCTRIPLRGGFASYSTIRLNMDKNIPTLVDMSNPDLSLDGVFHALSDPTRRAMLANLAEGERNIGELASPFAISFAAASKHVKVLEQAGLIRRRVE